MARLMSTDLTVIILGESGTGKELIAARCTNSASAATAVRRRQHGRDPQGADRKRAVRP